MKKSEIVKTMIRGLFEGELPEEELLDLGECMELWRELAEEEAREADSHVGAGRLLGMTEGEGAAREVDFVKEACPAPSWDELQNGWLMMADATPRDVNKEIILFIEDARPETVRTTFSEIWWKEA